MRRPPVGPVSLALALALGAAACRDAPVRLVAGRADTVVVNGRRPAPLPVHGLDARGREREVDGLRFRWVAGAPIHVTESGWVTCERSADAEVEVSRGALATRFLVMCRPVLGFRFRPVTRLALGGPPAPLPLDAVGVDGESVVPLVGTATVDAGGVAAVRAMHVHPRARGWTRIRVEVGDCVTWLSAEVIARVPATDSLVGPYLEFADTLRLVPGEVRTWRVPAGGFVVHARPLTPHAPRLTTGFAGGQCATWPLGGRHCLALKPAQVVVLHPGPAGRGAAVDVELTVRRLGELPRRATARPVRAEPRRRLPVCREFPPA